jgi:hypothetical protein
MVSSDATDRQNDPTATRALSASGPRVREGAASVPKREATVQRLIFTLLAALGVALILDALVCLLPENDYQRWQLQDVNFGDRLRWIYERIHFDHKPIDIAILGPSRAQLGLSAEAVEQDLAQRGKHANVVNFALPGAGRDIQWAILDELFKAKSPKAVVLEVEDRPYPFGHFAFKYVAPAEAIVFPPTPFLHNYLDNLSYLPTRKLLLFGANLFPDLFGLSKQFDPEHYAQNRTDFSTSFIGEFGKLVDMEHPVPRATLLAEPRKPVPRTLVARAFTRINGVEDHQYIRKIAREAKAHGTQLIFVFIPMFNGPESISDLDFLKQFGPVLNDGDLAPRDELFENWGHLNHAGAMIASARLADAIVGIDPEIPTSKRETQ